MFYIGRCFVYISRLCSLGTTLGFRFIWLNLLCHGFIFLWIEEERSHKPTWEGQPLLGLSVCPFLSSVLSVYSFYSSIHSGAKFSKHLSAHVENWNADSPASNTRPMILRSGLWTTQHASMGQIVTEASYPALASFPVYKMSRCCHSLQNTLRTLY